MLAKSMASLYLFFLLILSDQEENWLDKIIVIKFVANINNKIVQTNPDF